MRNRLVLSLLLGLAACLVLVVPHAQGSLGPKAQALIFGRTLAGTNTPLQVDANGVVKVSAAVQPPTSSPITADYLVQGGQVAWQQNYQFMVSAASYVVQGTSYTSTQQNITLSASDPTNDRIDVIALDTTGTVVAITGTAAATPGEPSTDPGSQLKLVTVYVPANSTQPSTVSSSTLYAENTGGPGEWNCTTSGSGFNCNATNDPHGGTHNISAVSATNTSYVQLQIPSSTFDPQSKSLLVFYMHPTSTWGNNRGVQIGWYSGGVLRGSLVQVNRTGSFGFNSSTNSYQQVAIPLSQFGVTAGTTVTQLRFIVFGGTINFSLDDVTVQGSGTTVLSQYALTDLTNVLQSATPRVASLGLGANPDSLYKLTVSGAYYSPLVAAGNSGTAKTIDWSAGNDQLVTLTGNVTFTFSNPISGGRYVLLLNTGAGSFTAAWPAAVKWPGGTAPTITTTASKEDLATFIYDGSSYIGSFNQNY